MRIEHPFPGEPPATPMASYQSRSALYRSLVDRCQSLEEGQERLREQFDELVEEQGRRNKDGVAVSSEPGRGCIPGFFFSGSPYRSLLDSMGHAVIVCSASSGEITYWNRRAEDIFGWKDHDVLGKQVAELLIAEEHYAALRKIMERLSRGQSWSGQFPYKKRSGERFMALVTKTPLYEDGELVGFITVLSDAAILNSVDLENLERRVGNSSSQARRSDLNMKRIQWHSRPPIAPVPHIASSVSNMVSKLGMRGHEDDACISTAKFRDKEDTASDSELEKPGTIGAKVLAKLQIRGNRKHGKEDHHEMQQYGVTDASRNDEATNGPTSCGRPNAPKGCNGEGLLENFSKDCDECMAWRTAGDPSPSSECQMDGVGVGREANGLRGLDAEDGTQRQSDAKQFPSSGDSIDSHGSSSSKGEIESNAIVDCEIRWEDLRLGEEIGQGSYAVVYHGIWNGSDVAVKLYSANEYSEGTLEDYKKEISIMKTLRHPNVLLFMGAVYSQERLAIVTEFLPRGSLFKTLHKSSHSLDIRRRMRMALDVARGMNYLHHRHRPIVHRDLKSSNLLVDKNWTVKVGDFGLSRLKNGTFLTAKSGRGTPQWMAPEVLRNEPSNEKSDVFSFGVILWELMTESIPWNNLNSLQVVGVVGFMDRRLELPKGLDPQVASIIHDCWQSDPARRPSFEDIIKRMVGLIHKVSAVPTQKSS